MQAGLASEKGLCSCCRAITLEHLLRPEGFSHISQPSLLSSSGKDCRICNLIYSSILNVISSQAWEPWRNKTGSDRFTILRALKREKYGIDQILVCFGFCTDTSKDDGSQSIFPPGTCLVGRLEVFTDKEDPAANFVDYRSITGEPDSERSWFMVDRLVAECTNHHALCRPSQVGTLPSRIMELRSGVDDMIFPIVSNGRRGNYTALSYCWGGPQKIVATKGSWEKLMEGIPLQVLPKTIQDAVVVTRRLGHQYLWVDSLCILQDSEQDWLSEASKMADIYGNARVTISAAGGSDCNAGCFMKGEADTGQEVDQLVLGLPNGDTGTIYLRVNNYYKQANDPLNKRGWALQERLLSPRLLIYSAGRVSWQCQTKSSTPGIGSARLPNYFFDNLLTNGNKRELKSPIPKTDETLFILWAQIALDYSRRDLTYESDALPALSGLARRLQDITGDEYLAGLWKESLCKWLMWHTATYIKSRPLTYLAPTWSWLSLRGPVLFVYSRFDSDSSRVKVLDAITILAGPDTTGPVSAGKITLHGQVKEVQRRGNEIWEVGTEQACKVGLALLDLVAELVDAIEGPLSCLRVSEYNGLLLKPSGVDYQRVGIFITDLKGGGEDVETYPFKDWEMRTLTIL